MTTYKCYKIRLLHVSAGKAEIGRESHLYYGGDHARPEDARRDRPDAVEEEIAEVKRSLQQLHRLHRQEEAS